MADSISTERLSWSEKMPAITWALSSWTCKYPDDLPAAATRAGFEAVEWDLNFIPLSLSYARRKELRKCFRKSGIKIRFHLPYSTCDVGNPNSRARIVSEAYLRLNIDLIKSLGGTYAVMHFAENPGLSVPSLETLADIVRYSRRNSITLAIENLLKGPTSKPHLLSKIARAVGADIALDVGHACAGVGVLRLREFLAEVGDCVSHVHVYSREDRYHNHLPIENKSHAISIASQILKSTSARWWTCEMDSISACIRTRKVMEKFLQD
jgi:sugar phosphate isomerase/epimerase